jgi:hypothetical protein
MRDIPAQIGSGRSVNPWNAGSINGRRGASTSLTGGCVNIYLKFLASENNVADISSFFDGGCIS